MLHVKKYCKGVFQLWYNDTVLGLYDTKQEAETKKLEMASSYRLKAA